MKRLDGGGVYAFDGAEGGIHTQLSSQYQQVAPSLHFQCFQISRCGVESSCTEEFVCVSLAKCGRQRSS